MKKKIFTAALAFALSCGMCGVAYAAEKAAELQVGNNVMKVNMVEQTIDAPPVIVDGRTLVPVRAVVEALDGTVDWDAETKTAKLVSGDNTIELTIDSTTAKLNGAEETLDVAPMIIDGRTMLPIRFVAESFGFYTDWDGETKTVYVAKIADAKVSDEDLDEYAVYHTGEDGTVFVEKGDRTVVYDKDGETIGEFLNTYRSEDLYTDKDGKTVKVVNTPESMYFEDADGKRSDLTFDKTFTIADEDKNTYQYYFGEGKWKFFVKNSEGELINELVMGDTKDYFKAEDGKELAEVTSRFGKEPYIGYIMPDGTFVKCERDYSTIYTDEEGNLYGDCCDWLVELTKDGKAVREYKPMSEYNVVIGADNKEAYLDTNKDGDYVIRPSDGEEIVLTVSENSEGYGDDVTVYEGSDGKTYIIDEDTNCTVKDKDGKETKLTFAGYGSSYESSDGTKCSVRLCAGEYTLIKADGTRTKLTESEGEG